MVSPGILSAASQKMDKISGAGTGVAVAALQGLYAINQKKKADAAFPELVDPNQAAFLAEIGQKKNALTTGADTSEGLDTIEQSQAAVNDAITRNAGGNAGGAIQGLLSAQSNTNMGKNQVLAGAYNNQMNMNNAYGNLLNLITMKKQSLQLRREQGLRAEYSSAANAAMNNFLAAVAQKKPGEVQTSPAAAPASNMTPPISNMLLGKPQSTAVEATGAQAPMVTPSPEKTLASLSLGTPMALK